MPFLGRTLDRGPTNIFYLLLIRWLPEFKYDVNSPTYRYGGIYRGGIFQATQPALKNHHHLKTILHILCLLILPRFSALMQH